MSGCIHQTPLIITDFVGHCYFANEQNKNHNRRFDELNHSLVPFDLCSEPQHHSDMSLINISNIEFKYPSQKNPTIKISDFKIDSGEKVFLYGPSGCGKTTLLEILAGILTVTTGEYFLDQLPMHKLNASKKDQARAEKIGYIFQSFNLIPYLNVSENILLPLSLKNKSITEETHKKRDDLCHKLGINEFLNRPVHELSVGQQQRVAVARSLMSNPKIILADEPTSALDHDHREKFIELLFSVCKQHNIAVLFVSHDQSLMRLFDRSVSLPKINHALDAKSIKQVGVEQ